MGEKSRAGQLFGKIFEMEKRSQRESGMAEKIEKLKLDGCFVRIFICSNLHLFESSFVRIRQTACPLCKVK